MTTATTKTTQQHCIKEINELLRGELSAIETYGHAISKFGAEPGVRELNRIQGEHRESAHTLRQMVRDMGGTPSTESGSWGSIATGIQKTANFFGADSALASLKQGEKHGENEYQSALDNDDVMDNCKRKIRETLLPRVQAHQAALDGISEQH